jgi:hypothetical protein
MGEGVAAMSRNGKNLWPEVARQRYSTGSSTLVRMDCPGDVRGSGLDERCLDALSFVFRPGLEGERNTGFIRSTSWAFRISAQLPPIRPA